MTEEQAKNWIDTADLFRREVRSRIDEATDVGELEMLVRVLGIACDVAASVTQLGHKAEELDLERYRIELHIEAMEQQADDECDADAGEIEQTLNDQDEGKQG